MSGKCRFWYDRWGDVCVHVQVRGEGGGAGKGGRGSELTSTWVGVYLNR